LVRDLKASGADLSTYESAVPAVFEYLFEKVLVPKLQPIVFMVTDEEAQSNAFRRYMIGQCFLYAAYRHVPGMSERGQRMAACLKQSASFSAADIERIREMYATDVEFLHSAKIITADDQLLYNQICPIFSPRFLSYDFDKATYNSVPEAIQAVFGKAPV
jgi:hypothetical protein